MNIGQKRELKTGDWVVVLVCIVVILLCILPMINLLAQSLSSAQSVINSRVKFIPMVHNMEDNSHKFGVTLESYRYVFLDKAFARSMWWTAILTVICTIVSLSMTILCAYPLTYDWLKGKYFINTLIIFTMYFSAGTIPNYVLMKSLGLLNNPLVLIIPNCLSVFNMIILRSSFLEFQTAFANPRKLTEQIHSRYWSESTFRCQGLCWLPLPCSTP